jgi:serine protease Do
VVDRDIAADLALVKTDLQGAPKLAIGKLDDSGAGTGVISIGTPKGLDWSVSRGIVSAVREKEGVILLQTDAAVNPGNSGGPLINADRKEVIGVISFALKDAAVEGLNFAVSAEQILKSFPYLKLD